MTDPRLPHRHACYAAAVAGADAVISFWKTIDNAIEDKTLRSENSNTIRRASEVGFTDKFVVAAAQSLKSNPIAQGRAWLSFCEDESIEGWDFSFKYRIPGKNSTDEVDFRTMYFQAKSLKTYKDLQGQEVEYVDFTYTINTGEKKKDKKKKDATAVATGGIKIEKKEELQAQIFYNWAKNGTFGENMKAGYLIYCGEKIKFVPINQAWAVIQEIGTQKGKTNNAKIWARLKAKSYDLDFKRLAELSAGLP